MPRESPGDAGLLRFRAPFFLSSLSRPAAQQDARPPSFRPGTPDMADSDSSDCAIYGHQRRRQRSAVPSAPQRSVIDLTKDSPPRRNNADRPPATTAGSACERPAKRRRVEPEELSSAGPSRPQVAPQVDLTTERVEEAGSDRIEELDLTSVETEQELHQKREEQRERHERHQQVQDQQNHMVQESIQVQQHPDRSRGPTRLGELQCVICMETMTNMTATHCGHIFCHTCIMEALIAGERQSDDPSKLLSKCPVCRMKVLRNPKSGQPHIIPLELKFTTKSKIAKGKERA